METSNADLDDASLCIQRYDERYNNEAIRATGSSFLPISTLANPTTASIHVPESEEIPDNLSKLLSRKTRQVGSDNALQRWEGYVVKICADTFIARLTDLTNKGQADSDEAEIPLNELDDEDRAAIAPGKIFSWAIGYTRTAAGTRRRFSALKFRQLPRWTAKQIEKGLVEARKMSQEVTWE